MLIAHPGEVVSREEIRKRLWPNDTIVEFDHSINAAVKKLRIALEDSAENPRFVETVARRGYRLLVPIEHLRDTPTRQAGVVAEASGIPHLAHRKFVVKAFVGAVAVVLVTYLSLRIAWKSRPTTIRSIAVLPLENLSGDSNQDYFADGMTDQLITDLGQIGALRVISRTSIMRYRGTRKPLPEIGRELNADAIVEGTVLHSGTAYA
jgi:DNA-binding winged helix-turn-helix (wHTH) protein